MAIGDEIQKILSGSAQIGNIVLLLSWYILHLIISIWYQGKGIAEALESYAISSRIQDKYKSLNLDKLHNLAIVIDNEEAHCTLKVIKLLQWLAGLSVKHVCLYDAEGVLKNSKGAILEAFNVKPNEGTVKDIQPLHKYRINLDFLSSTDGKEGMAKAADHLFAKLYLDGNQKEPIFTESDISEALKSVGAGGPEPELLLVYGPTRCHLGFPAWRTPYTEIVHMGSLKCMKYGSLIKAMHKFSMVRQNYGR